MAHVYLDSARVHAAIERRVQQLEQRRQSMFDSEVLRLSTASEWRTWWQRLLRRWSPLDKDQLADYIGRYLHNPFDHGSLHPEFVREMTKLLDYMVTIDRLSQLLPVASKIALDESDVDALGSLL